MYYYLEAKDVLIDVNIINNNFCFIKNAVLLLLLTDAITYDCYTQKALLNYRPSKVLHRKNN